MVRTKGTASYCPLLKSLGYIMMINYLLLVIVLSGSTSLLNAQTDSIIDKVSILQDGEEFTLSTDLNNPSYISITTGNFIIKTPLADDNVSIQVCASSKIQSINTLKITKEITEHPCFRPGTGTAMRPITAPQFWIPFYVTNGQSHNYYSSDRRVSSDDSISIHVEKVSFVRVPPSTESYVIIIIDKNIDTKIQDGEVWYGKIYWK